MSRSGDEYDEMTTQAGTGAAGVGDQDEVARFLVELRALGDGDPPTPSPELAAVLGGATPLAPRRRIRPVAVRAGVAAAAVVAALVVAAAGHSLPQPAQRVVSDVVNTLTPFDITPGPRVAPTPTPTPAVPAVPPEDSTGPGGGERSGSDAGGPTGSDGGSDAGGPTGSDGGGRAGSGEDGAGGAGAVRTGGGTEDGGSALPSAPASDGPTSAPRTAGGDGSDGGGGVASGLPSRDD